MTNFEYYKKQILTLAVEDSQFGMNAKNMSLCGCKKIYCMDCAFSNTNNGCDGLSCGSRRTLWLYTEHVEKPTITKKEKAFLEACKPELYIARDQGGAIYVYTSKPHKYKQNKNWNVCDYGFYDMTSITKKLFGVEVLFPFIKWEDKEPWKVEDLLKLEVK